jgi:hypothetical protein
MIGHLLLRYRLRREQKTNAQVIGLYCENVEKRGLEEHWPRDFNGQQR